MRLGTNSSSELLSRTAHENCTEKHSTSAVPYLTSMSSNVHIGIDPPTKGTGQVTEYAADGTLISVSSKASVCCVHVCVLTVHTVFCSITLQLPFHRSGDKTELRPILPNLEKVKSRKFPPHVPSSSFDVFFASISCFRHSALTQTTAIDRSHWNFTM